MKLEFTCTRLAPSPTGALHLGHARTFLITWWLARQAGAKILMRMDDLDAGRAKPATPPTSPAVGPLLVPRGEPRCAALGPAPQPLGAAGAAGRGGGGDFP